MRLISIFFVSFLFFTVNAQNYYQDNLDTNMTNIYVNASNMLIGQPSFGGPGYEVPKGGGNFTIYDMGLWLGAKDQNDNLYVSTNRNNAAPSVKPGPYSSNGSYVHPDYADKYINRLWKVTKNEIIYHIDNFQHPNYVMPASIEFWPANGDPNIGVANDLAPFVDVDNDGVYNPYNGDYPCIKGDAATFLLLNDDFMHPGNGLGVEIHVMYYQYAQQNGMDTTTFMHTKVINRGGINYPDFRLAFYVDTDIGFAFDDFIGSDSSRNLGYGYNGLAFDQGGNGAPGYGYTPPVMGLKLLNKKVENIWYFKNAGSHFLFSNPVTPADFWNYMNSKWKDGQGFVVGGAGYSGSLGATNQPTKFIYHGNPYLNTGWTSVNMDGNGSYGQPVDQRFFVTVKSTNLNAADLVEYDCALIYSGNSSHLKNVDNLLYRADEVQLYYEQEIINESCETQGTGVQDPNLDLIVPHYNANYFEITRLDGEGNMSMGVYLHPDTETQILQQNTVDSVRYKIGEGPIYVERLDSVNYVEGYYVIKVLDDPTNNPDWRIYQYDSQGGNILDSVDANTTLLSGDTIVFPQYGIKVSIRQDEYFCYTGQNNCPIREKTTLPVDARLTFQDNNLDWLTGVKSSLGFNQQNWIMSGIFNTNVPADPSLGYTDPTCYLSGHKDQNMNYFNLLDGIVTHGGLARYIGCGNLPIGIPESLFNSWVFSSINMNFLTPVFHPSIDIVFTADQSLWTRCAVIELSNDETTSIGGGLAGFLRQSPSVDKDGNPDGTGVGMSWFPGYAIDVETGRRLNMAFGENSSLINENGGDMIWNPTSNLYDGAGNPVMGGQHVIYVFGREMGDITFPQQIPAYDEGQFIDSNLSTVSIQGYQNVYRNLSWVMYPILNENHILLETDTRLSVRVNKEFKKRTLSGLNNGNPMFGFEIKPYPLKTQSYNVNEPFVNAFPNPANNSLNIHFNVDNATEIIMFAFDGKKVHHEKVFPGQTTTTIDVSKFRSGLYLLNIGGVTVKVIVNN